MTDREKLIGILCKTEINNINGHSVLAEVCFTPSVFEKMADHLIANGVTVQRWIPVTERLPGTEKVLITDGEIVMRGYRRPDGVWKYGVGLDEVWEKLSLRPVTHWMPLPEPPKGE